MFKILLLTLSLIAAILVNLIYVYIPTGVEGIPSLSNRLQILFMPALYVHLIWIPIYVYAAIWIRQFRTVHAKTSSFLQNTRFFLFFVALILQISWFFVWHYDFYGWTVLLIAAQLAIFLLLYWTYPKRENEANKRIPISLFIGWVFIAFLANSMYMLTFLEWSGWGLSNPLWTVILLTFATAFALHFLYHHADRAISIVFIWTFIGIAIKNGTEELFVSAAALFLTAVLLFGLLKIPSRKEKP